MNIVITDITILSKLVFKACELGIDLAEYQFYAVQSALTKPERREAIELERMGILHLDELPDSEEETLWLYNNYHSSIGSKELMAIRYAIINKHILLTNNPIIADIAKHHGVRMLDVNDIKKKTNPVEWFWSQHVQLRKVASLLYCL